MSNEKARFRNPVIPDCELHLEIEAIDLMEEFGNIKEQLKLMVKEWPMQSGQQQL